MCIFPFTCQHRAAQNGESTPGFSKAFRKLPRISLSHSYKEKLQILVVKYRYLRKWEVCLVSVSQEEHDMHLSQKKVMKKQKEFTRFKLRRKTNLDIVLRFSISQSLQWLQRESSQGVSYRNVPWSAQTSEWHYSWLLYKIINDDMHFLKFAYMAQLMEEPGWKISPNN